MGANFYIRTGKMQKGKTIHLGKASYRWAFMLQSHPEHKVDNLESMVKFIGNRTVFSPDHMKTMTGEEFATWIMSREWDYRTDASNKYLVSYGLNYDVLSGEFS